MRKLLFFLFLLFFLKSFSQVDNHSSRHFAMKFLEENILIINSKSNNKIQNCIELLEIEVDTIGNYKSSILFLKFKLGKNKARIIDEKFEIYFNSSTCDEYIIGYDIEKDQSYRLKGFNGNDLFYLMRNINQSSMGGKSNKRILAELKKSTAEVNFKEIYIALRKYDFGAESLKTCTDGKIAHGKI